MPKIIWKYPIQRASEFTLDMPEGGFEFLSIQMQNGAPCMWVLIDPEQRKVPHRFRVLPTGQEFDRGDLTRMPYLGTFQPVVGLVFHLFQVL